MKKIKGTIYRREGKDGSRLYKVIECQDCGAITYERRQKRIEAALKAECKSCKSIASKQRKEALRLLRQQDKALIDAHRAINKLHQRLKPDKRVKHGLSRSETRRTYCIWKNMIDRCYNANNDSFNHYGGRGITVCDRWHDVSSFIEDMGIAPDGYSIERHDVNGNYEPFNCSWIPLGKQSGNRRSCYINRGIFNPDEYKARKQAVIASGSADLSTIPFGYQNGLGWWRQFGLYVNPYIYGPMPWKRKSLKHRKAEAIERGWYVPPKNRKK